VTKNWIHHETEEQGRKFASAFKNIKKKKAFSNTKTKKSDW